VHGRGLHAEVLHVPLIFIGPGVPKGERVENRVSQVDIMPTVLNLLGETLPDNLDGIALFSTSDIPPNRTLYAKLDLPRARFSAIYKPPYKLMVNLDTQQSVLYDVENDPVETKDILDDKFEVAVEMLGELTQWDMRAGHKNRQLGGVVDTANQQPAKIMDALLERLRALGYVNE
jgi:arylsulfatase A-like enzyme